jgi:hypothetical protein
MQRVLVADHRPSKYLLMQPLPLAPSGPGGAPPKLSKRTTSFNAAAPTPSLSAEPAAAPPSSAGKKLPPKLSVALPSAPQLPGNFPATPTAHMALAGGLHKDRSSSPVGSAAGHGGASGASLSAPGHGAASSSSSVSVDRDRLPAYGLHSPLPGSSGGYNRFAADRGSHSSSGGGGEAPPAVGGSGGSFSGGAPKRMSHLSEVGHAGDAPPASPKPHTSSGAAAIAAVGGGAGSALRPSLKVALPADPDYESMGGGGGSSGDVMYSPSTPAGKSGMKERMKFYFQRQAGQVGGF